MKVWLLTLVCLLGGSQAMAWQGMNLDTGAMIEIQTNGNESIQEGNIEYYDYDLEELKLGYLNMYEQNFGLILDLETGDLVRVRMNSTNQ